MNGFILAASAASLVTFAIHTWVGGPSIARPLLNAKDLGDVPKYTHYFCWHIATITLFWVAAAFGWAAISPEAIELAWFAFSLCLVTLVWNIGLIIWKRQKPFEMPQWVLFGGICGLALPGLF